MCKKPTEKIEKKQERIQCARCNKVCKDKKQYEQYRANVKDCHWRAKKLRKAKSEELKSIRGKRYYHKKIHMEIRDLLKKAADELFPYVPNHLDTESNTAFNQYWCNWVPPHEDTIDLM
jgi:hypothetical protein